MGHVRANSEVWKFRSFLQLLFSTCSRCRESNKGSRCRQTCRRSYESFFEGLLLSQRSYWGFPNPYWKAKRSGCYLAERFHGYFLTWIAITKHLLTFPCGWVDRSFPKPRSDPLGLKSHHSSSCNLGQEQNLSLTRMEKLYISDGSTLRPRNCLQLVPSRSTQPKTMIQKKHRVRSQASMWQSNRVNRKRH